MTISYVTILVTYKSSIRYDGDPLASAARTMKWLLPNGHSNNSCTG